MFYLGNKNKDDDQLCSFCAADLWLQSAVQLLCSLSVATKSRLSYEEAHIIISSPEPKAHR